MLHEMVAIQHRMHGADRGQVRAGELLPELLADLGRTPARVLSLQPNDRRLNGRRQPIRLAMRPSRAIGERPDAAVFVAVEDLVARFARDAELGAQRRHLLAVEQAGHKAEPLVHDVTLLPRHAPSSEGAKVSPMCPEYRVTYVSGRTRSWRSYRASWGKPPF